MRGKRLKRAGANAARPFLMATAAALIAAVGAVAVVDTAGGAGGVDTNAAGVNRVIARVDTNSVGVDTVVARVDTNSAGVETVVARVDTNSAGVNRITARVDTNSAGVDTVIVRVDTNSVRVDTVVTVNANAVDTDDITDITNITGTPDIADNPSPRQASPYTFHAIFFAVSLAIVAATVFYFCSRMRGKRRFLTTMRLSVLDRTVQKACRYIENRFDDPALTVDGVCRELVTGEAYLNTLFVKEIGIDVRDFIAQVRVNGIKFFLKERPAGDIERICTRCGFESKSAAEKPFAKICGVGIDEYARSIPPPSK